MENGKECYDKAHALFDEEKIEEALKYYLKAAELGYDDDGYAQNNASYACVVLKKYKDAVTYADQAIAIDPRNATAYGNKGIALKELGRYEEAVKTLEKAHSLDKFNAFSLCHKASALNYLGREEEAIADLKEANQIMKDNKHTTDLVESDKKFIMDTIESVLGLHASAQNAQKALAALDTNNVAVKKVMEKFNMLKIAKNQVTGKVIDSIGSKPSTSDNEEQKKKEKILESLRRNPSQIHDILAETPEAYSYPEVIPYLVKAMTDLQVEANKEIKEIKTDVKAIKYSVEELTSEIKNMKHTLKQAGVYDKAKIKEGFEVLYEESPKLHEYAKSFYWTLLNYFAAYRSISTQLVSGNTDTVTTSTEKQMVSGLEKASSYLIDMAVEGTKSIPLVGSLISLLDGVIGSIYDAVKEKKLQDRVGAINHIIMKNKDPNALLEEDISTSLALTALDIAIRKKEKILNLTRENASKWQKALDWLDTQISSIKEAALGKEIDVYESESAQAALKDVLLLLAYLYKNYQIVSSKNEPLSEQFANIILTEKSDDMMSNISTANSPGLKDGTPHQGVAVANGRTSCCTLF